MCPRGEACQRGQAGGQCARQPGRPCACPGAALSVSGRGNARGRPSAAGGRRERAGTERGPAGGGTADMCRMSFKKETPLANAAFWAAKRGNLALLKLLLNSGRVDVDCRDSSGTTALFFAAQQGHNDVVRFLFGFGASTECRTKDGGTALLAASQYGHMPVVETLLKHGANIHDQLYDGATALFLAAQGGYLDVIRLLLSSGAKVNQPRQDGTAPLWIASQMGHSEVVRVMLLRGADRDAARNDGTTALLKAANKGYNDVIEELLKFSPTLGILKNGTSALHAAVLSGNVKTVALLLEAGADPALRNKANELPAELTKNERILHLLRQKEGPGKNELGSILDR
ncbi:ankyrin repeat domain-containing protein 29 isoform X3 [Mus musculus]|uniref:ankyrin repeat domain-containing protein 29 isoform X3 n=1 Tax=Mus musculus TaxID=10090 RepID=UPI0003D78C1F|nr:ankyrin repeat domain-containing protein 29 isoform X3 [Mus musculus]|eukprot:XP_017173358.1 PREDICTED: ankyrin repeat domain-containing protein 29 isoform X3 [Mus musculus]